MSWTINKKKTEVHCTLTYLRLLSCTKELETYIFVDNVNSYCWNKYYIFKYLFFAWEKMLLYCFLFFRLLFRKMKVLFYLLRDLADWSSLLAEKSSPFLEQKIFFRSAHKMETWNSGKMRSVTFVDRITFEVRSYMGNRSGGFFVFYLVCWIYENTSRQNF